VPFAVSEFDLEKALRWRESLAAVLRRRDLAAAFDAAQRVRSDWVDTPTPVAAFADEALTWIDGELYARIDLPRPKDTADDLFDAATWAPYAHLLTRTPEEEWKLWLGGIPPAERDGVWAKRIAPRIARKLLDQLQLAYLDAGGGSHAIAIDATLVSTWRAGATQLLTLRPRAALPTVHRADIASLVLSSGAVVPSVANVVIERGSMRYRTAFMHHAFFADRLIENDLATGDDVQITVPLDAEEKRRPRDEDRRLANALLDHLNAHLEYYHRQIWLGMHPNRRYLLLDGFEAPNAGGRSVASVIENRVIGVAGNSLIFPVAPGVHLDPGTVIPPEAGGDLLAYYNADAPPPVRISVPTRGVYAEAIMGNCNSCEVKDDTRFWRWEQAPIPDKPAELGPVSMATRNQARSALRPDEFSTPIVKYQDAGNLPQGNGFQAALNLLGTPNLFRDLTGVDANIQASSTALGATLSAAQAFGGEAAKLAQQRYVAKNADRILATIKKAKDMKLLPDDQAAELTARTLDASVGKEDQKQDPLQIPEIKKLFERVQKSDNGSAKVSNDAGSVSLSKGTDPNALGYQFAVDPPLSLIEQTSDAVCWAAAGAMLMNWRDGGKRTLAQAASDLGGEWRAKLDANSALSAAELRGYANAIGLVEDAAGTQYSARSLLNVLRAYGPLWVIHDDFASDNKLVHVRIVVGISGEGGGNQAMVKLLDPASSTPLEESFEAFAAHLTAPEPVRFAVGVLHFPAQSP
ncbi:MAG: hypothetical protein JWM53_2936, partial [bacterium]|nr:hypothetical protein [bacterium]